MGGRGGHLRLLAGDREKGPLCLPLRRHAKLVRRLKWGGGEDPQPAERSLTPGFSHLAPKSPAGRKRWFSEAFGFKKPSAKMSLSTGGGGTRDSETFKSPGPQKQGLNKGTQWDLQDSKSSGSFFILGSGTSNKCVQSADLTSSKSVRSQTSDLYGHNSVSSQTRGTQNLDKEFG